jgi:hypothetical protein
LRPLLRCLCRASSLDLFAAAAAPSSASASPSSSSGSAACRTLLRWRPPSGRAETAATRELVAATRRSRRRASRPAGGAGELAWFVARRAACVVPLLLVALALLVTSAAMMMMMFLSIGRGGLLPGFFPKGGATRKQTEMASRWRCVKLGASKPAFPAFEGVPRLSPSLGRVVVPRWQDRIGGLSSTTARPWEVSLFPSFSQSGHTCVTRFGKFGYLGGPLPMYSVVLMPFVHKTS